MDQGLKHGGNILKGDVDCHLGSDIRASSLTHRKPGAGGFENVSKGRGALDSKVQHIISDLGGSQGFRELCHQQASTFLSQIHRSSQL